jgi:hypothetical protein
MYAAAFIGDKIIDLAGWDQGQAAETSGLNVTYKTNFQGVSYIGGTYGRQFFRPGTMASASFTSRFQLIDFLPTEYQRWASYFMQSMPVRLANQSGCTVRLSQPYPTAMGIRQVETLTGSGTAVGSSVLRMIFTSIGNDVTPQQYDFAVADGQTSSQWMSIVRNILSVVPQIQMQFSVSGTGSQAILTRRSPYALQDNALSVTIQQITGTGIASATSENTTSVTAWTLMSDLTFYDASVDVAVTQIGTSVILNTSVNGRLTSP